MAAAQTKMQGQRLRWSAQDLKRLKEQALSAQWKCQLNINYSGTAACFGRCNGSAMRAGEGRSNGDKTCLPVESTSMASNRAQGASGCFL